MTNRLINERGILHAYPVEGSVIYKSDKLIGTNEEEFAIFLDRRDNSGNLPTHVRGHYDHGRSCIIEILEGQEFQYVDIKGIGYIVPDMWSKVAVGKIGVYTDCFGEQRTFGIFNKGHILDDVEKGQRLASEGLRTVGYILVIHLDEIRVGEGYRITVKRARGTGIIGQNDEPVIGVRRWNNPYRLHDILAEDVTREEYKEMMGVTATSLQREGIFLRTESEYWEWFNQTIKANLEVLHKRDLIHNDLIPQNIGLDGTILDLDTVRKGSRKEVKDEQKCVRIISKQLSQKVEKLTKE